MLCFNYGVSKWYVECQMLILLVGIIVVFSVCYVFFYVCIKLYIYVCINKLYLGYLCIKRIVCLYY